MDDGDSFILGHSYGTNVLVQVLQTMLQPRHCPTWVSHVLQPDYSAPQELALFMVPVSAGFPSPAEEYLKGTLDLNKLLIRRPVATFFVRVVGDSMMGAGIHSQDLLVVDRSLEPTSGRVIIAVLNGELTVKRLQISPTGVYLVAENQLYQPIAVTEAMQFEVWGTVTYVIHSV